MNSSLTQKGYACIKQILRTKKTVVDWFKAKNVKQFFLKFFKLSKIKEKF